MKALQTLLARTISEIYACTAATIHDDCVVFGLDLEHYRANISFALFEKARSEVGTGPIRYAIGITFCLTDTHGEDIDVSSRSFRELEDVCFRLQENLDWGTLSPIRLANGQVEVGLYRSINTTAKDLNLAALDNHDSELQMALDDLTEEYSRIYPILLSFVQGEKISLEHIGNMVGGGVPERLM